MTRHGSLAYYLAAWICGCFFLTLCVWLGEIWRAGASPLWMHGASGLLFAYFYGLILGFAPVVLAGFILRRAMSAVKWKGVLEWMLAAAIVFAVAIIGLAGVSRVWMSRGSEEPMIVFLLVRGAALVVAAGWWLAVPAGAATGLVLQRVNNAFNREAAAQSQAAQEAHEANPQKTK